MLSLADAPASSFQEDLLALESMPLVEYRMDSFQEGIQALLETDISDFDVDTAMIVDDAKVASFDPLFLLDEVVGN